MFVARGVCMQYMKRNPKTHTGTFLETAFLNENRRKKFQGKKGFLSFYSVCMFVCVFVCLFVCRRSTDSIVQHRRLKF